MDRTSQYLSFYVWYNTRNSRSPILAPLKASLVSCSVAALSLSDIGKEISKLKNLKSEEEKEEEKKKFKDTCRLQHQQYHVLTELKIQDLHFRLKTLIDTGSDLNMLNKHVIPVSLWEKIELTVTGLGIVLNTISFYIPEATLCFQQFCLKMKFFLAEIPVACVLGTPFLAVISPHGST